MQPIRKLDQQHADVVGNRQQQFAQVFGLLGLARDQFQPFQLGQALDQRADLWPEHVVDLGAGGLGVLNGVVQQRRDDGGIVELETGQDGRDLKRMGKIGIARRPYLFAMSFHGIDVGSVQQILVCVGVVGADTFDKVVLTHHSRARRLDGGSRHRRRCGRFGRGLHLPPSARPTAIEPSVFIARNPPFTLQCLS